MPIYEYQCQACDAELEKLQRMSDDPLKDCPECGKPELKRLISAAGFRLKGAGWYETDFKSGNKRNIADSGNEAAPSKAGAKSSAGTGSGKKDNKSSTSTKTSSSAK